MAFLIFDTSTNEATAAVVERHQVLAEARRVVTTHSEGLLALLHETLESAGVALKELEAIAVGRGPGSYTGVRIGLATAKGLCFAGGKPLVAISSLWGPALAAREAMGPIWAEATVATVLDARRAEVFVGVVDGGNVASLRELVCRPEDIADHVAADTLLVGDGAQRYEAELKGALPAATLAPEHCHAMRAATLAPIVHAAIAERRYSNLAQVEPVYLRSPDIRPQHKEQGAPVADPAERVASLAQAAKVDLEALRQVGLRLDRHGRWWHQERLVEHERLAAALHRWIDRLDDGRHIVRLDEKRFAYIELEDTPYLIRTISQVPQKAQLSLTLSDGSSELLDASTLKEGAGGALYCQVKGGRFAARLTQQAQLLLGEHIAEREGSFVLQLGDEEFTIQATERPPKD